MPATSYLNGPTIHQLACYFGDTSPLGELTREILGYFDSLSLAEDYITKVVETRRLMPNYSPLDEEEEGEEIFYFELFEFPLNRELEDSKLRNYDSAGNFHGEKPTFLESRNESFQGLAAENCRLSRSNLVQFASNHNDSYFAILGIVAAPPPTPSEVEEYGTLDKSNDSYLVVWADGLPLNYSYLHESELFEPRKDIPKELEDRLSEKLKDFPETVWSKKEIE